MNNVKKGRSVTAFIIMSIGTLMMMLTIFMPYKSGIKSYSLLYLFGELSKASSSLAELIIYYIVLISISEFFALLAFIFALCRKPVPVIVFILLSGVAFIVLKMSLIGNGFGIYVYFIALVITLVGAIIKIAANSKAKRINSITPNNEGES